MVSQTSSEWAVMRGGASRGLEYVEMDITLAEQIAASTARIYFRAIHNCKFPNWAISLVFCPII